MQTALGLQLADMNARAVSIGGNTGNEGMMIRSFDVVAP